ncbi:MAG TPA: NAD(P)-dependent alcohol dehydrogenase [Candidatus Methylomirabilis sp.]|nr:NAD(P)-dependent alcohol dehydrogenase [Candidatus Methylomirabilis sp.]
MQIEGDWGPEHIRLAERPQPRPERGQVLLRMEAASLNYRDVVVARRGYGRWTGELPLVPLSDGAGRVVAVGDGVTRVKTGDLVCPIFCQGWIGGPFREGHRGGTLGGPRDGVMQEYMVLAEEGVARAPRHYDAVQAATLPCAAVTAWNAVVHQGQVKPGDAVVVQGTGGVSLFALAFAKMCGARVIATSSSDAKLERAKAMGADHLINYVTTPDWARAVKEATGGIGADLVVEVAGSVDLAVRAVHMSGTVALIGVLGGASASLSLGPVVTQNIRLQGIFTGSRDLFEDMVRAIEQHGILPAVHEPLFAFEEVGRALEAFPRGGHFGKVCSRF